MHTNGTRLGGHAIKIIGFGEMNVTTGTTVEMVPYWTIANSWCDTHLNKLRMTDVETEIHERKQTNS